MTIPTNDEALAVIEACLADVNTSQIDNLVIDAFAGGYRMIFDIDGVDREEGDVFCLSEEDGGNHVVKDENEDTETLTWSHFRDEDDMEGLEILVKMDHRCGGYSDDETDANADVVMIVVPTADLEQAKAEVTRLWREGIAYEATSKFEAALGDVLLLEKDELMKIVESESFVALNRRIAEIMA